MNHQTQIHLTHIIELASKLAPLLTTRHPLAIQLMAELEVLHDRDVAPSFAEALKEKRIRTEEQETEFKERMEREGPLLWAELHSRTLKKVESEADERLWLARFAARLPCGRCRQDFRTMLRNTPPRLNDYFHWSVDVHNAVNTKLGKPTMTYEEALQKWMEVG